MKKLKEIWQDKRVRFAVVTIVYILWFVVWTRNLWWLLGLPFIYDYYFTRYIEVIWLNRYRKWKSANRTFGYVMEWIEALLYAVVVVVPLKLYFFGLYVIPTPSMEGTLLCGDYIFVNRLEYGPKMPVTPLSFPFVQHTLPLTEDTPSFLDWIQFDYKRLAGFSEIKRGDVVVFNFPAGDTVALASPVSTYYDLTRNYGRQYIWDNSEVVYRPVDHRELYVKRLVGMAGDTLQVIDDMVYINGEKQPVPPHMQREQNPVTGPLDAVFPHSPVKYPWTALNYGPVWIPKAGETVRITIDNIPLYYRIIKNYEGHDVDIVGNTVFIDGEVADSYTFAMNYYFMMGDNRDNSLDSRYWGFVPEDHIEGKACFVWLSIRPEKNFFTGIRWNRLFTRIQSY